MKVSISNAAFSDLGSIKEYYIKEGVGPIGDVLVSKIIEHICLLEEHPDIGRVVPEYNMEHIRELIHSPFRIVYLREKTSIHIVRIWRSERELLLPDEKT